MLKFIREKNQNFIVKIFLGMIVLAFAAFFGLSGISDKAAPGAGSQVPAIVNGEAISSNRLHYIYNRQIEKLQSIFKGNIPQDYANNAKSGVLNQLINEALLSQELEKLGLKTSKDELVDNIKSRPQFAKDGQFDFNIYKAYLPNYLYTMGSSYEKDLMQELAGNEILATFETVLTPTPEELHKLNLIINTTYKFSVIRVPKPEIKSQTNEDAKTPDTKAAVATETDKAEELKTQKIAQDLLLQWKGGKNIKDTLDQNKLKQTDTQELSPGQIRSVFGGKGEIDNLKKLLALSTDKPFVETPIEEGRYYYLVKLTELKKAQTELDKDSEAKLKDSYQKMIASGLEEAFIKELHQTAKIELAPELPVQ